MVGFVLCADDFAMTAGISRGILELLAARRLTATGAMTNRPHWPRDAAALLDFDGVADLGVHLNLTCGKPLTRMPVLAPDGRLPGLKRLIALSLAGRLPLEEIRHEFGAQLDGFEHQMGRAPDFVDGHQHVHGLKSIQPVFLDVIARRYQVGTRPYVRTPEDRKLRILRRGAFIAKAFQVRQLTIGFGHRLELAGFPFNDGFAGFSGFDPASDYAAQFATYLKAPGKRHLVMCHPGYVDEELPGLDPVTTARETELAFFASERFAEICARANATPVRMAGAG